MDTERSKFTVGDKVLFVRRATVQEEQQANLVYSKNYGKYLKEDLPLAEEVDQLLKKRGLFGAEYDNKLQSLLDQISQLRYEMGQEKTEPGKRQEMSIQLRQAEQEYDLMSTEKTKHFAHTVESRCDQDRFTYLLSVLIEQENGTPYWGTLEALYKETDAELIQKATKSVVFFLRGLPLEEDKFETLEEVKPEVVVV